MERQQSNTLHTPNISNSLSTGDVKFTSGDLRDLSAVLKNCPEVNQLWMNNSIGSDRSWLTWTIVQLRQPTVRKIGTSVIDKSQKSRFRGEKSKAEEY